jgi:hypothetical protein
VRVGQAATLAVMPVVADALADGPVTPGHLASLTRATTASPALAAALAEPEAQAQVVELARRLDASAFGRELARQAASLDPASRQGEHDEQFGNRYLNIAHTRGGTLIKGALDSIGGHRFQLAIDALSPRPGQDDPRDKGQRNADAVAAMAERIISDADTGRGSVVPTQVSLIVGEETWAALRDGRSGSGSSDAAREPGPGSTADVLARLRGVPAVTDEDGGVWPASEVARSLCDCELTRIVMNAEGRPLDVGFAKRLFTAAQRKGVVARDGGGCTVPGCGMPARYTQLHYLRWWRRHGGTDIANCCQLCVYHHGYVHRHDIRIERNRDGRYVFTYPDGRMLPGSPPADLKSGAPPRPSPGGIAAELRPPPSGIAAELRPPPGGIAAEPYPPPGEGSAGGLGGREGLLWSA